jgi:hypothetical protein
MTSENTNEPGYRRLNDTAASLYAETLEHLLSAEAAGLERNLRGSFKRRTISGREYWYYQYRDLDQRVRQIYCGPVGGHWDDVANAPARDKADGSMDRSEQAALLRAAGFPAVPAGAFRLLTALADAGLFKAGAVLVGTYAFMALGNQLGIVWTGRAATTQDIDIAHDRSVEVAVEDASLSIPEVLEGLELGHHPIPKLDPRHPSTSFMFRNEQLRLDLLTPPHGRRSEPIHIPALGAPAQVLRFLDYLIETPQPAVLVGSRVVRTVVPDPARFAVHKLLVSGERTASEPAKARKDLDQAGRLLHVLLTDRPGDLAIAWRAARSRGQGWRKRLDEALPQLPQEVSDGLAAIGA